MTKVAIVFWGLTRSLKYTIDSLKENVLMQLKNNNVEYDMYMHTYNVYNKYTNKRAGEIDLSLDNNEYKLLNIPEKNIMIDDQDTIKSGLELEKYRTHKDPWSNDYKTMDNYILAMYSKLKATHIVKSSSQNYSHIIFLRPDVKFYNPFKISWLKSGTFVSVPNFAHWRVKMNDRMAICDYDSGIIYGELFNDLYNYSLKSDIHSEHTIFKHLKKHNIPISYIEFNFNRVRANGKEKKDYFSEIYKSSITYVPLAFFISFIIFFSYL